MPAATSLSCPTAVTAVKMLPAPQPTGRSMSMPSRASACVRPMAAAHLTLPAPPTARMRYPGTITVPEETFERFLEYATRSFRLHGFRDVVFLGDHGGYRRCAQAVADRLNRDWAATPVRGHAVDEYYRVAATDYPQALQRRGFGDDEIGMHEGLADTSLALAVDPGLVRMDVLRSGAASANADGVRGDPRRSTAELGQLGIDAIVTRTADAIRRSVARRH